MKQKLYAFLTITVILSGCAKEKNESHCPKGYTGNNCDQEITPAKIQVTRIEATTLPPFDVNGSNWDPLGGKPDIYFKLIEESTSTVIYTSAAGSDMNTTAGAMVDLTNSNVLINNPTTRYSIEAWDYDDLDPDDYMGGISFMPYTKGQNFPSQVAASCPTCNTAWKLNFTYLY